jgi:hypothetical protein
LHPRHSRCDCGREEEVPEEDTNDDKEEKRKRMKAQDFNSSRKRQLHSCYDWGDVRLYMYIRIEID